jgi:glycerol transport system ATP-binding protein
MARITLQDLKHSYSESPESDDNWALKHLAFDCEDGGAYALLGPSGCGKTTLLNIISGLLTPTEGRVLFDDKDVTGLGPDQRNIAQVFQFPVVYDTMTVYENLAFPLRNRGIGGEALDQRVRLIAEMIDLTDTLDQRASGLSADGKQKISLGRGLVRSDVNVIMFDEPLTVIDPHLKWQLRSKLKELHQQVGTTMIYVTHDQIEALTFADKVVVMHDGSVVQIGTPVELFERPQHTFVGHFIGSPGMNVLNCELDNGKPVLAGKVISTNPLKQQPEAGANLEIGIRPEFIHFAKSGLAVKIVRKSDAGRFNIVETSFQDQSIKLLVPEGGDIPSDNAFIRFDKAHTQVYADSRIIT